MSRRAESVPDPYAETRPAETAAEAGDDDTGSESDTDRNAPSLPTALFERYKIKRKLGAGGMGVVYEAVDNNLHRVVALKVLKLADEDPQKVAEAGNRLVREARAMAVLSHRNVVTVYDVGMHGALVYVAMQLVEGTTLRQWLAAEPRSITQRLHVLCDAGAGLAAAHRARIIHRDFKPDNVLVSRTGTVRVTDFGLARRASFGDDSVVRDHSSSVPKILDLHDVESVTRSGAILGTPAYMPPEQSEGRACDARADQFSFCVTAWEALYGERPFAGKSWSELYSNVIAGKLTEPDGKSRVPRTIEKALRRGISVDPAQRFDSMNELLDVLAAGIEREHSWLRYLAIPLASAAVAGAVALYVSRDRGEPAPRAAPAISVVPIVQPAPAPAPVPEAAPVPVATPGSASVPDGSASAIETPSSHRPRDHHRDHDKAVGQHAAATTMTQDETPVAEKPPVEVPAQKPVDPADAVRAKRKELDDAMRERGLRVADLPASAQASLADATTALGASDIAGATKSLADVEHALAGVVIDHAFISNKLARINKRLEQSKGREAEFRALYVQLKGLVEAKKFAEANALLNDMTDRLSKK